MMEKENVYELLTNEFRKMNFVNIWELMDELKKINVKDYNLYLFLLGHFIVLPEKEKEYLKNIRLRDVKISVRDVDVDRDCKINNLRFLMFTQRFSYALSQTNRFLKEGNDDIALYGSTFLLKNIVDVRFYFKRELFGLIRQEKYREAKKMLDNPLNGGKLSLIFGKFLHVIDAILVLQDGGIITVNPDIRVDGLFSSIDADDYQKALYYANQHNQKYNDLTEDSEIMTLLLEKINSLIKSMHSYDFRSSEAEKGALPTFSNVDITMGRTPVVVNDYGVERMRDIFNLILGNVRIDKVQEMFHLSDEQITLVGLVLAREFFNQGIWESGCVVLSAVEERGVFSDVAKSLYSEVKLLSCEDISLNDETDNPYILSLKMVNPYLIVQES